MANDKAQQPGPLTGLHTSKRLNAAPVCCSAWFGDSGVAPDDQTNNNLVRTAMLRTQARTVSLVQRKSYQSLATAPRLEVWYSARRPTLESFSGPLMAA